MVNIAVVGAGYWGKNLVRNFYQLGSLYAICDREVNNLNFAQYNGVKKYSSFSEVVDDAAIEGVVIATPAEMHYQMAEKALLSGRHVFVEKPLSLSEREGTELIRLAKQKNLILMVGHLMQYHPGFIKLNEMVNSGELGKVNYIYSHRLNLGKIRREENILWSFAPHDISMILSLAGEMPEKVFTTGGNYLHNKIADVTTTHLDFPSGLRAHIFVSWLHPFKEQRLVVVGERKMAVFCDTVPWEEKLVLYPHQIVWEKGIPVPNKAKGENVTLQELEPLGEEAAHFVDCIKNGKRPRTDGEEGYRVLKLLNSAQESLETGIPVKVGRDIQVSEPRYFAHESAYVDPGALIGERSKIWHFTHILPGVTIGENCNIGQNVVIGPDVTIGRGCKIQNNVSIYKGVTLEDFVFCGPSMVFTNVFNPRAEISRMHEARPTLVRKGATIGANATIICGITIGQYAFVAAGAVVTKDVPDYALMIGNPAKQVGWVCRCSGKLNLNEMGYVCKECGKIYEQKDNKLIASENIQ